MLCAKANGEKCLAFVLLPRKRILVNVEKNFKNKLVLSWSGSVWMDQSQIITFLHKVFKTFSFGRRLLVWDSFRCHNSEVTKQELKKLRIDTTIIPGRCTKYIQAPDVSWNKPFKQKIQEYYHNWLRDGKKSYTAAGNLRAPPIEEYLKWIVEAWENITPDLIQKSFKCCGISTHVDGCENDIINFFKPAGICPSGSGLFLKRLNDIAASIAP